MSTVTNVFMKCRDKPCSRDSGMALPISLIILIVISILGLSSMRGAQTSIKLSSNVQQKFISFEAAESVVVSAWEVPDVMNSLQSLPANDYSVRVPLDARSGKLSTTLDQTNQHGTAVDLTVEAEFQYCGEAKVATGTSLSANEANLQLVGIIFDMHGRSAIGGSRAKTDIIRRGSLVRPATDIPGSCITPGL